MHGKLLTAEGFEQITAEFPSRQRGTGAADRDRDAGDTQAGDREEQAVTVAVGVAVVEVPGAPSHRAAVGAPPPTPLGAASLST